MSVLLDMMMVLDSKLRDHKSSSICLYLSLFILKGTWKVFHLIVGQQDTNINLDGARGKFRGSPKSVLHVLWGP